jgi:hypothetical protein
MVRDFFQDLITFPTLFTKSNFWRKLNLRWQGPRPSLALRLKFLRDTPLDISNEATIRLLTFEAIKYIGEKTNYFNRQVIKENEKEDHNLLEASWLKFYPHEVTVIKIQNIQNENFISKHHHGGPYRGASLKGLRSQITKLCFEARKKGLSVTEVQIIHTHPSVEAIIEDGKESSFIFNGLSTSDIQLGKTLAPFVPYPLRVKAVTPAANYSMLF